MITNWQKTCEDCTGKFFNGGFVRVKFTSTSITDGSNRKSNSEEKLQQNITISSNLLPRYWTISYKIAKYSVPNKFKNMYLRQPSLITFEIVNVYENW